MSCKYPKTFMCHETEWKTEKHICYFCENAFKGRGDINHIESTLIFVANVISDTLYDLQD